MTTRNANWAQIKPLEDKQLFVGCLCCSTACRIAHADLPIAVGFGSAVLTKNGELIYEETHDGPIWTVADAEKLAAADPDNDWRILKNGPLHGETFQRHMKGKYAGQWVCIESDNGFA